ncbi:MAG: alpha-L-rhamnosidase [Chitinophagaceae bacterium]|nr:MAG: alpha-L-rhamnosidase [Chitinophagaceae bacterium]
MKKLPAPVRVLPLLLAFSFYNDYLKAQSLPQDTPSPAWTASWIESTVRENDSIRPAQYFRKTFTAAKKIKSAVAYITSHGVYEAWINGKRVGDAFLTPGWTSYKKRLQYQRYDVTALLGKGTNSIGVILGNGWYRGSLGWGQDNRNRWGNTLALLCQVEVIFTDGSKMVIGSDDTWKTGGGSVQENEIYHGETINAGLQQAGWNTASYNDASWSAVKTSANDNSILVPTINELVRKHETFTPVKIFTTAKGEQVIDFGQNLVGWVIVKAAGDAGRRITIKHTEVLDRDGNFYTENLRSARATASYILSGKGEDVFEPHFTFYGFRYIKVEGYPGELKPENFTAVAVYSDMKPTGTFSCSNPLLNQLQHNITWGQRGNFLDVPTDCPQRDERLGWTGDAQAFFRTASYNYDVKSFFSKWMKDVAADQRPDGAVTHVVPDVLNTDGGSSGWSDVGTIIPWQMYEVYGDKQILVDQYASMKKWIGYMESHTDSLDLYRYGWHYGDWLSYRSGDDGGTDAITDKFEIAQCFYAHSIQLTLDAAKVLGQTADVEKYTALLKRIKAAYNREYVTGSGRLVSNTQTSYVLALQFDMLPEGPMRTKAASYLAENVGRYGNHLTTGFLGTPYLCHVLSRFGYNDLAYILLLQDTFPSWLYPVKKGATTIWERWDGIKPDGSFQNAGMNSFNHYAYGAIGDWMYQNIAGIKSAAPGFKKIIIKPIMGGNLTWAEGTYESAAGLISSKWKIENNKVMMDVVIPKGATAEIYVPDATGKDYAKYEVVGGSYHYEK